MKILSSKNNGSCRKNTPYVELFLIINPNLTLFIAQRMKNVRFDNGNVRFDNDKDFKQLYICIVIRGQTYDMRIYSGCLYTIESLFRSLHSSYKFFLENYQLPIILRQTL